MKDILNSYSGKELRRFVIEHNKKVKDKVKAEVKEIKNKILGKRLIDIRGLKKDDIVDKMLEHKQFFKDIKMREVKSEAEDQENLDKLQKQLTEYVNEYIKNQDEDILNKNLKQIKKDAEKNDLELLKGQSINKLKKIIVDEHKRKPKTPPAKPLSKPMFVYDEKSKMLRLKPKPKQPTRKPPPPKNKKDEGTHEMPDGTVMTGETHNENSVEVPNIQISDFDEEQFKNQQIKLLKHLDNKNVKEERRRDIALQNIQIDRKDKVNNPKGLTTMYKWVQDKIKSATTKKQLVDIKKFIAKKTNMFAVGDTPKPKLERLDL